MINKNVGQDQDIMEKSKQSTNAASGKKIRLMPLNSQSNGNVVNLQIDITNKPQEKSKPTPAYNKMLFIPKDVPILITIMNREGRKIRNPSQRKQYIAALSVHNINL